MEFFGEIQVHIVDTRRHEILCIYPRYLREKNLKETKRTSSWKKWLFVKLKIFQRDHFKNLSKLE